MTEIDSHLEKLRSARTGCGAIVLLVDMGHEEKHTKCGVVARNTFICFHRKITGMSLKDMQASVFFPADYCTIDMYCDFRAADDWADVDNLHPDLSRGGYVNDSNMYELKMFIDKLVLESVKDVLQYDSSAAISDDKCYYSIGRRARLFIKMEQKNNKVADEMFRVYHQRIMDLPFEKVITSTLFTAESRTVHEFKNFRATKTWGDVFDIYQNLNLWDYRSKVHMIELKEYMDAFIEDVYLYYLKTINN